MIEVRFVKLVKISNVRVWTMRRVERVQNTRNQEAPQGADADGSDDAGRRDAVVPAKAHQ